MLSAFHPPKVDVVLEGSLEILSPGLKGRLLALSSRTFEENGAWFSCAHKAQGAEILDAAGMEQYAFASSMNVSIQRGTHSMLSCLIRRVLQ